MSLLCASLNISSYLLYLSQCVSLPLSVSPVRWRNRLKMEGCVSCPKTEVTTAPKTMHDFLQADGHAEPPMHARASIWEWLGTETGCYGDCREIGQWKNHSSSGRLQSLRLRKPCLCDSALMANNASELKSNSQAICTASLYFSTTSLWIKTLH